MQTGRPEPAVIFGSQGSLRQRFDPGGVQMRQYRGVFWRAIRSILPGQKARAGKGGAAVFVGVQIGHLASILKTKEFVFFVKEILRIWQRAGGCWQMREGARPGEVQTG